MYNKQIYLYTYVKTICLNSFITERHVEFPFFLVNIIASINFNKSICKNNNKKEKNMAKEI